ncbi:MAG: hypothetical protein JKX84_11495, partial [Flavobacteriales bacterium]|nr:hypothetical protein [Flavobacteriales bacterium]
MENRNVIIAFCLVLFLGTNAWAQKNQKDTDRGYAFESRNLVVGLGSGFFGYSYGYGKLGGAPLMLSFEYGLHRYIGAAIYGGLLDRNPKIGENSYDMTIYTVGIRGQFHVYNLLDDILKTDLRGDVIDVYGMLYLGMDAFRTSINLPNKRTWYISGGFGVRVYPFKKAKGLGVFTEFSPVLMPWQLGVNYK